MVNDIDSGNILGYSVILPCRRCLESCNNGHYLMFYNCCVHANERLDGSGELGSTYSVSDLRRVFLCMVTYDDCKAHYDYYVNWWQLWWWRWWPCLDLFPLLALLFGIAFYLQLVLLSYHPIFLRPYHFLKLVSFLGANWTKIASVCPWLLRGAI